MDYQGVLFLCTGNYYRSRTAEELFNFYAQRRSLPWRADSKGLKEDMGVLGNIGTISHLAANFLNGLEIPITGFQRAPISVMSSDFSQFQKIICLDKSEHRPMMENRFPEFADQVEYWEMPDVDFAPSYLILPQIHEQVLTLIKDLTLTGNKISQ